jgi:hypothetical protein
VDINGEKFWFAHFDDDLGWVAIRNDENPIQLKEGIRLELGVRPRVRVILKGDRNDLHGLFLSQGKEPMNNLGPGDLIKII